VQSDIDESLQPPQVSMEIDQALAPLISRLPPGYRIKAGGNIELHYFDSDRQPGHSPDLTKIGDTFEKMLTFIGRHLR